MERERKMCVDGKCDQVNGCDVHDRIVIKAADNCEPSKKKKKKKNIGRANV